MAIVKRTAAEAWRDGFIDSQKVEATTEADIASYMIKDGEDPADPLRGYRRKQRPKAPQSKRSAVPN